MSDRANEAELVGTREHMRPTTFPHLAVTAGLGVVFLVALYSIAGAHQIHDFGAVWALLLSALAFLLSLLVTPRNFTVGFLTSLLPLLLVWRIAAMAGGKSVPDVDGGADWTITGPRPWALMVACGVVTILYIIEFAQTWRNDVSHRGAGRWLANLVWGATLIRIWFGFNEIGHASEKIFAGHDSWAYMANQVFGPMGDKAVAPFSLLGSAPGLFVVLAGIIELAFGLGIGFGFMTRLAGVGGILYLLIATLFYGGEWLNGYGWAGGGWEYPMLLIVFLTSFVLTGPGPFSIDLDLRSRNALPSWMRPLSIPRSTDTAYSGTVTR